MNKLNVYDNLLNSREAFNTYLNTYGEKFDRMRELRNRLRSKELLIEEIAGMIENIRYNEILNKNQ